jgi:maltose alpha-D-glucosyltransferase/alpha-amylase
MTTERTSDVWWKNAVLYCLDVETFQDSDGDGCGDIAGLTERVDYLAGIGVTCLWLMPFYPTPSRDDGYDITDFFGVDQRLGSAGDFVELVRTAQDRGLRVIADLVVNHTSSRHPWFQAARAHRDSPHRDWYVWRDEPPEDGPDGLVFPDKERSNWEWDEEAGQYYLHRFYRHQPDLNVEHPAVRDEIAKVIGYWLHQGLAGFRVDAVPFLLETEGIEGAQDARPHEHLKALRAFMGRRRGDAILLGEVNLPPEDQRTFFGDEGGDELQMVFSFTVNQAMYLSLVRADAGPLRAALEALPEIPADCQWANFVRNHDELTLDKLSEEERAEVFAAFGPEERMQLYGRGLRRRAPSMLDGDQRRLRLLYSLMFSLPGTPVLFYGEEIGMAENLEVEGRMSVRTPMQWEAGPTGGFSSAPPERLRRPPVQGEAFGPAAVNVARQRRDPGSLLNWMERLIRLRKECPELGWGAWRLLDAGQRAVFAHRCDWEGRTIVALHNLGAEPVEARVELDEGETLEGAEELLGDGEGDAPAGAETVALEGYGYRWLRPRP